MHGGGRKTSEAKSGVQVGKGEGSLGLLHLRPLYLFLIFHRKEVRDGPLL